MKYESYRSSDSYLGKQNFWEFLSALLGNKFEKVYRLLNNTQHGFRSGRSCMSALLNVFDYLMNMIDNRTTVDMIYLDFPKAFDKVNHGIVLHA